MDDLKKVAVVTGGNKGIGYEIVKGLAAHGLTTILTARDESRGSDALRSLHEQHGFKNVHFHKLDVTDSASIEDFTEWLTTKFGGLQILVNNAGITELPDKTKTPLDVTRAVLETNYVGVRSVTERLIPLMNHGARIINMSSSLGRLDNVKDESMKKELSDIQTLTVDTIDKYVQQYIECVRNGRVVDEGWPDFMGMYDYCVSKVILNAYSRVLARELSSSRKIYVNCMCPGVCSTDINDHIPLGHNPEVGAETAVWLAVLPESEILSGKFYVKKTEVGFEHIPVFMNDTLVYSLEEFQESIKQVYPQFVL